RVRARVLVAVDDDVRRAAAALDDHGHQLVGEPAGGLGGCGPLLGADGKLVLLLPRDRVVATQVLRGLEHAAGDGVVLASRGLASTDEAVHQLHAAAADPGAQTQGVVLDVRHRLDATRHDDASGAAGDL